MKLSAIKSFSQWINIIQIEEAKYYSLIILKTISKKKIMKIQVFDTSMPYDITLHVTKEKGLTTEQSEYLMEVLRCSILMVIKVDGKLRQTTWKYWNNYVMAHCSCCGSCDEDSLAEVEKTRNELLENSTELTNHALDF